MRHMERLKSRAKEIRKQLTAVYYAYRDSRVTALPKLIIGITVLYALSPIDLIPDFIPVIGYVDDLLIIPALIGLAIKLIPAAVMDDAQARAEREPVALKKNWTFAVVFVVLWVFLIYALLKALRIM